VVRDDGHQYYEMLFVYVDDILALSHQAKDAIEEITAFYKAKDGSIKHPRFTWEQMYRKCNYPMVEM
jgi:hypothetical protein